MTFTVELKSFERGLDDIAKKHLSDAARGYLNEIAFQSRIALGKRMETDFDHPNRFTMSAFLVRKAGKKDGQKMEATIYARPVQEEYLRYQVFGGTRRKGDVGATPWDVVVGADKQDGHGNIPRRYLKQVAKKAKREREQRSKLRGRRDAARLKPKKRSGKSADLRWVSKSKNAPGIFFARSTAAKAISSAQSVQRRRRCARRVCGPYVTSGACARSSTCRIKRNTKPVDSDMRTRSSRRIANSAPSSGSPKSCSARCRRSDSRRSIASGLVSTHHWSLTYDQGDNDGREPPGRRREGDATSDRELERQ